MTEDNRKLLMADLCARLPYGVKTDADVWDEESMEYHTDALKVYSVNADGYVRADAGDEEIELYIDEVKPYLRSVENLPDDEVEQLNELWAHDAEEALEFVHSRHIDVRDLIGKGLAAEAPEGMYQIGEL